MTARLLSGGIEYVVVGVDLVLRERFGLQKRTWELSAHRTFVTARDWGCHRG